MSEELYYFFFVTFFVISFKACFIEEAMLFMLRQHCFLVTQHGMEENGDGGASEKVSAGMCVRVERCREKKKKKKGNEDWPCVGV